MGKLLDTFRHPTGSAQRPLLHSAAPLGEEEIPYIEVGGRQAPIEASPAVLAATPVRLGKSPQLQRLRVPPAEVRGVSFRPLPAGPARFAPELVAFHQPEHAVSRQYQALAATLAEQGSQGQAHRLLFTAAAAGVGATTVVLNLAITLARQGQRVVVVDAQHDRPAVAERLGLPPCPGLDDVLAGVLPLAKALQPTGQEGLLAVTAGRGPGTAGSRRTGDALRRLARQLRDQDGIVLLDGPAPDGDDLRPLAAECDAAYLISADGRDAAADALLRSLPRDGVPLRGHILARA
jgi:Mrp family chromosome partitioning ATPase